MDFTSTRGGLQQSGSAGPQENLSVSPSADSAAFEQQLREIANAGGGVPTQASIHQVGASLPEGQPLREAGEHEYPPIPHGGRAGTMLAVSVPPPRPTWAFVGRSGEPLYSEDAPLVEGLRAALIKGGFKERTAKSHVDALLRFGRWLLKNNKQGIAERLYDGTLDSDAAEFKKAGERGILTALGHLRASQAAGGVAPIASRANPSADDADLIKQYKSTIIKERKKEAATAYKYATALGSFSEYLRNNARPGIAARLYDQSLDEDLMRYEASPRPHPKIGAALVHLRQSLAGDGAVEHDSHILPEHADLMDAMRLADAVAQDSALQRTVSWPEMLPAQGHDQDAPLSIIDQPSPSSYLALQPGQVGRSAELLYSEDVPLILGLKEALLRGGAAESTARSNVDYLLSFGRWLFANDKPPIADRLDHETLDKDVEEFITKRDATNVRTALAHLRTSQVAGGVAPVAGRADLNPYPEDAALIKQYKEQAATAGTSKTAKTYASLITDFGHYLRENNKQSIASRLGDGTLDDEDESLNEDINLYRDSGGHRAIGAALEHLRTGARKLGPSSLHAEDAELISALEDALIKANFEKITAQTIGRILRRFSRWLVANEKPAIASRLYDRSLEQDAATFDKGPKRRALAALDHLRAAQSPDGIAPNASRAKTVATPFHSEDAQLISGLEKALVAAKYEEASAQATGRYIRKLSQWLFANNKPAIAGRIGEESLDKDVEAFKASGGEQQVVAALAHLRASQSAAGIAPRKGPRKGRPGLSPYPEDADLIRDYKATESKPTARNYAPILTGFSDYLRQSHKQSIAAGLSDGSLEKDVEAYKNSGGHAKTGAALAHLLKSPAGVRAIELRRAADAAGQHPASAGRISSPADLAVDEYDQHLSAAVDVPGMSLPLEPALNQQRAQRPEEYPGPLSWHYEDPAAADEPIDALDWGDLLPSEEVFEHGAADSRPTKRQRIQDDPQDDPIEQQLSQISNSEVRALVQAPADQPGASLWQAQSGHDYEAAPHVVVRQAEDAAAQQSAPQGSVNWPVLLPAAYDPDVLWGMLEDRPPWSGSINPDQAQEIEQAASTVGATSSWSLPTSSNFDWTMLPTTPSPVGPQSSDVERRVESLVDLLSQELRDDAHFAPIRTPPDAQIAAGAPTAPLHGRSGPLLGVTECLGDEHITADYTLVEEELQRIDPDLAAQTRFVRPAQAQLLRLLPSHSDRVQTFRQIVNDQDGNDTANFLFVPVNDGGVTGGGAHWSLLLVDRRVPTAPVAYHYDSAGSRNSTVAEQLAARFGSRLQPARMARQQNGHDCGVYVVDATRALIGRLAQGERPDNEPLHLEHLNADRPPLQERLRGGRDWG